MAEQVAMIAELRRAVEALRDLAALAAAGRRTLAAENSATRLLRRAADACKKSSTPIVGPTILECCAMAVDADPNGLNRAEIEALAAELLAAVDRASVQGARPT